MARLLPASLLSATLLVLSCLPFAILPAEAKTVVFNACSQTRVDGRVSIDVPEGWRHRNAEGMMEMSDPRDGSWIVLEVSVIHKSPEEGLRLLSHGAEVKPYGSAGNCYVFETDDSVERTGDFVHTIPAKEVFLHLSWNMDAARKHPDAVETAIRGLRLDGRPVVSRN